MICEIISETQFRSIADLATKANRQINQQTTDFSNPTNASVRPQQTQERKTAGYK
jgi:hypothetical protein